MRYVSKDGHWRVTPIVLSGRQLIRVEHDSPRKPDGSLALHSDWAGYQRLGPQRTGLNWWLMADVRSVADLAAYVSLGDLEEVKA